MKYTDQGIQATHQEMVNWMDWRAQSMLRAGLEVKLVQKWAALTAAWLSTGESFLNPEDSCPACKGTGQSKLMVGHGLAPCFTCKGSGVVQKGDGNLVHFPEGGRDGAPTPTPGGKDE